MKRLIGFVLMISLLMSGCAFAEAQSETVQCPNHNNNVKCVACHWTGTYKYQYTSSCFWCIGGTQTCYQCKGSGLSGWNRCFICNGAKKIKCSSCDGSGVGKTRTEERVFCPDCYQRNIVCVLCWGMDGKQIFPQNESTAIFSYRKIMRTPDEYIGQNYVITGVVKEIEKFSKNIYCIKLKHDSEGIEYLVHLQYIAPANAMKILVGDEITAYGTFVSYDQDDIPALFVNTVNIRE